MQVQNNTQQVLVFGKTIIQPHHSAALPAEFDDHPTVDLLIRLRKLTPSIPEPANLSVKGAPPYRDPAPAEPEGFTPPTAPADPVSILFAADDTSIPAGWDEMHGNKCRAWIKKQDDVVLLGKMYAIEDRPKIRSVIQARIDTLEARD